MILVWPAAPTSRLFATMATAIPAAAIESRIVGALTAQGAVDAGLVTASAQTKLSVGVTVSIAADGLSLVDSVFWVVGPEQTITCDASGLFPSAFNANVKMKLTLKPTSLVFPENLATTAWVDGLAAVTTQGVEFSSSVPTSAELVKTIQQIPFILRWALHTVPNTKIVKLCLQGLPVPLSSMDNCINPDDPDLCVSTLASLSASWASNPPTPWGLPGTTPCLFDVRSADSQEANTFPSSWSLKQYMFALLTRASRHPQLSREQASALINEPTRAMFKGASRATVWPPLSIEVPSLAREDEQQPPAPDISSPDATVLNSELIGDDTCLSFFVFWHKTLRTGFTREGRQTVSSPKASEGSDRSLAVLHILFRPTAHCSFRRFLMRTDGCRLEYTAATRRGLLGQL